jgi:hypothetical protein
MEHKCLGVREKEERAGSSLFLFLDANESQREENKGRTQPYPPS